VKLFHSRRGLLLAGTGLLLVLFLVRPGATRLKARIANSIGLALQRQVEIGNVHLRLLPQPGFDLENFVVHDDPSFSAEPILRADEVTAFLRLTSLLRGRLEISRLSLTEPSLNLVRNIEEHWNLESVLEHTAKTAAAPTSKAASESRPAFPYIEADHGRINIKFGREKIPFALTDAEYGLWQESENAWGMRLKARPVRTDLNLSDTGQVILSGTWQRAPSLRETPVQFSLLWNGAQLGQVTKLLSGQDKGWRGGVRIAANFTGTPANLTVRTDGSLEDFRRYDIAGGGILALAAHCSARYSSSDRGLHDVVCRTPMGDGEVALRGEVTELLGPRLCELSLEIKKVPLEALLLMARHAKKDLPEDLFATGTVNAAFLAHARDSKSGPVELEGKGEAANLRLQSPSTSTELAFNTVPFSLLSGTAKAASRKVQGRRGLSSLSTREEPHLAVGPFPIKLGRAAPATAEAWATRSGYSLSITGEAEIQRLLQVARTAGISVIYPPADGWAKIDLQLAGPWSGFAGPRATGRAQLHAVRAEIRGLNQPVEVASADLTLAPEETRAEEISASVAGIHWAGSVTLPRPCSLTDCPISFDLRADEISTTKLYDLLNPNPPKRPWYRFLSSSSQQGPTFLEKTHAIGKLAVSRVVIRTLVGTKVTADVELERGKLRLSDLRGDLLGGRHHGEWQGDFTVNPPAYSGGGTVENISLGQIAEAMRDNWISGIAGAKYQLRMAGVSLADLSTSATGSVEFMMRDGSLPHLILAASPLRVHRFTGVLDVREGEIAVRDGTLDSMSATFSIRGKASLGKNLDLTLTHEGLVFNVTGTLSEPKVVSTRHPETRAALKP
jgi:hypothetical protein